MRAARAGCCAPLRVLVLAALSLVATLAVAHGERAQQAGTRMRTVNWYDVEMSPTRVNVGDEVTLSGRFRTSSWWPEHIASVTGRVFLNVGTSGPNFTRVSSSIDGVSMVQSTSLELGRDYAFEMVLKARRPGRFHVHPILSVEEAGGMVGPGLWAEVSGSQADFENRVTTMFGKEVDLETYNLGTIATWHVIWFVIGGAWLAYWLRQRPLLIPRFRAVQRAEETGGDGDDVLTDTDRKVAIGFLVVTLVVIVAGFQWAERKYPVTTPLRTAKVRVPEKPEATSPVEVNLKGAEYRIPGRSFRMDLEVSNGTDTPMQVAEFSTANVRFINPLVNAVEPLDSHDLVASEGLRIEGGPVPAGETREVTVYAEDALWETQRLTHMINDPDSVIAGLLFFEDSAGRREIVEVGGTMVPVFQ
ncbi:MAG: bacterial ammonia monooxygenase, subunit AmoB [Gammaproteobacteria bacterium]